MAGGVGDDSEEEGVPLDVLTPYRDTSHIRTRPTLGPYSGPMSRPLWWYQRRGRFLIEEGPFSYSLQRFLSHGTEYIFI